MATKTEIEAQIDAVVYDNANKEIGAVAVNQLLKDMLTFSDDRGTWVSIIVNAADISAANTLIELVYYSLASRLMIHTLSFEIVELFASLSVTAVKCKAGIATNKNKHTGISTFELLQPVGANKQFNFGSSPESLTAAVDLVLTATATDGNLSELTAGQLKINIYVSKLP